MIEFRRSICMNCELQYKFIHRCRVRTQDFGAYAMLNVRIKSDGNILSGERCNSDSILALQVFRMDKNTLLMQIRLL